MISVDILVADEILLHHVAIEFDSSLIHRTNLHGKVIVNEIKLNAPYLIEEIMKEKAERILVRVYSQCSHDFNQIITACKHISYPGKKLFFVIEGIVPVFKCEGILRDQR